MKKQKREKKITFLLPIAIVLAIAGIMLFFDFKIAYPAPPSIEDSTTDPVENPNEDPDLEPNPNEDPNEEPNNNETNVEVLVIRNLDGKVLYKEVIEKETTFAKPAIPEIAGYVFTNFDYSIKDFVFDYTTLTQDLTITVNYSKLYKISLNYNNSLFDEEDKIEQYELIRNDYLLLPNLNSTEDLIFKGWQDTDTEEIFKNNLLVFKDTNLKAFFEEIVEPEPEPEPSEINYSFEIVEKSLKLNITNFEEYANIELVLTLSETNKAYEILNVETVISELQFGEYSAKIFALTKNNNAQQKNFNFQIEEPEPEPEPEPVEISYSFAITENTLKLNIPNFEEYASVELVLTFNEINKDYEILNVETVINELEVGDYTAKILALTKNNNTQQKKFNFEIKETETEPEPEPVEDGLIFEYVVDGDYYKITDYIGEEKDVKIPSNFDDGVNGLKVVEEIGDYAFARNQLTSVIIPENVRYIGLAAFEFNKLTNVIIPESVTRIRDFAFFSNQLTSVIIPENVRIIEKYAFAENKIGSVFWNTNASLKECVFFGNRVIVFEFSANTRVELEHISALGTAVDEPWLSLSVYVPQNLLESYENYFAPYLRLAGKFVLKSL